mmetsp:Transcript_20699/g.33458  ORF Transcript_20699/g.33458 Transcript_20699/m.33458 type:complete len:207 (+) Transcript_20699:1302-1922(+)
MVPPPHFAEHSPGVQVPTSQSCNCTSTSASLATSPRIFFKPHCSFNKCWKFPWQVVCIFFKSSTCSLYCSEASRPFSDAVLSQLVASANFVCSSFKIASPCSISSCKVLSRFSQDSSNSISSSFKSSLSSSMPACMNKNLVCIAPQFGLSLTVHLDARLLAGAPKLSSLHGSEGIAVLGAGCLATLDSLTTGAFSNCGSSCAKSTI